MAELDYPVAPDAGVAPVIYRAMIIQGMALRYFQAMQGGPDADEFTLENALEAAIATWETDWSSDPAPRTIDIGLKEVDADLQYWGEE